MGIFGSSKSREQPRRPHVARMATTQTLLGLLLDPRISLHSGTGDIDEAFLLLPCLEVDVCLHLEAGVWFQRTSNPELNLAAPSFA